MHGKDCLNTKIDEDSSIFSIVQHVSFALNHVVDEHFNLENILKITDHEIIINDLKERIKELELNEANMHSSYFSSSEDFSNPGSIPPK